MGSLEGKVAIITGASRGIGRAIAVELAALGARCVLTARDTDALAKAIEEIGSGKFIALDLRDHDAAQRLVDFAIDQYGQIDILINNAGATKRGDFEALTEEDWSDGFALKFFGAVRITRAAWPHLRRAAHGSVVNIAGTGGRTPGAEFSIGGSVNAAMISFTKSIAETGIRDGVQVNVINPGVVRTARFTKRLEAIVKARKVDEAEAERIFVRDEKVTKIGEPEDIAALVAFILSTQGRFLQGAMIDMDGGATKTV
jgi:NAD(P)-dependent dehydrogenase (short-subunit alcohol dehydrogenase family)